MHRKTAMKVQGGRPLRKNNWKADRGDYWTRSQHEIRLDKLDPGRGYRHVVTIEQLRTVIHLLPECAEHYANRVLDEVWPAYVRAFEI
jgi:hypothetical protein